jgi:hypothetical protein
MFCFEAFETLEILTSRNFPVLQLLLKDIFVLSLKSYITQYHAFISMKFFFKNKKNISILRIRTKITFININSKHNYYIK